MFQWTNVTRRELDSNVPGYGRVCSDDREESHLIHRR
jgi:hypothetical protein